MFCHVCFFFFVSSVSNTVCALIEVLVMTHSLCENKYSAHPLTRPNIRKSKQYNFPFQGSKWLYTLLENK